MLIRRIGLAAFPLLLAGCATGPSLQQSQAEVAPVPADRGRIYFYRTDSAMAWAVQPYVRLDGVVVGEAVPGGVFYCDIAPGRHIAAVTTEVDKTANVDVIAGQATYVRMDWGFGFITARIQVEVVPPSVGEGEAAASSVIKAECSHA